MIVTLAKEQSATLRTVRTFVIVVTVIVVKMEGVVKVCVSYVLTVFCFLSTELRKKLFYPSESEAWQMFV